VQKLAILLAALAMAPALAHAFEFPGKKRLGREAYSAVQGVYYPGFTLLGAAEPGGAIGAWISALETPQGTGAFRLTVLAVMGLVGMQAIYWTLVHATNKYWLQSAGVALGNAGSGFFGVDPAGATGARDPSRIRDRWEYSHIARTVLAFASFSSLVAAALVRG
jgi:hypothetical protein